MTLVLDAGALIALERNDRAMWRRMKSALLSSEVPITHGGVVGQVWRGRGSRSALLALALASIDVRVESFSNVASLAGLKEVSG